MHHAPPPTKFGPALAQPKAAAATPVKHAPPSTRFGAAPPPVQPKVAATAIQRVAVATVARNISGSHAKNMQESLTRLFGGQKSRWVIDRDSGSKFSDGRPNYTTGYHNVKIYDSVGKKSYVCDFHSDGKYYTRTH